MYREIKLLKTKSYITTLTPLRGIAALLVVLFHCNFLNPFLPVGYTEFISNSWLWVDFFFILSGFIICYAYGKSFKGSYTLGTYTKYMAARFARIYPLHFITTMWMFGCAVVIIHLTGKANDLLNLNALPACLLLVQSMFASFPEPPLNNPSWSLSTEWWVYVIFPFLVPLFFRLRRNGQILAGLGVILFYIFIRYILGPINHGEPTLAVMTDFGFLRCLAGFFVGMLLFTFYKQGAGIDLFKRDWFFIVVVTGLVLAMHFGAMDIIISAFFPFILIAAAYNQTKVKSVLDIKILQRLGDWSFSIYLVHVPIIYSLKAAKLVKNQILNPVAMKEAPIKGVIAEAVYQPNYLTGLLMCTIVLVLTIGVSAIFYRYLEIPSRNYLNGIFKTNHKENKPISVEV
jgi:peptidoglycan/LPS O-acetylase OafA/YrhL